MTVTAKGRAAWLDFLRILAAFLVIVNHTNSYVFKALTPENGSWYLSILWYYMSKTAVPLFVMISGACLLCKTDSYPKVAWRFLRVLLAALLAAYLYFLYDAWVYYGLWPRALALDDFLSLVWRGKISEGFWYLAFYLGLMLTLPLWQRLAADMERRDYHYLLLVVWGIGAAWPLLAHYVPEAALSSYFNLSFPCTYVGLFFAGQYIRQYVRPSKKTALLSCVTLAALLALCLWLTRLEFDRVPLGAEYWFLDDWAAPALPVILMACALMLVAKYAFSGKKLQGGKLLAELGGCAFPIYLLQDLLVAESKKRLYLPLCQWTASLLAALCWEIVVFSLALVLALILRRIPGIRKVI